MKQENLTMQAAKGATWISIEMLGIQLASFVVFVAISHYLTPTDFGVIGVSFLVVQSIQTSIINNITILVSKERSPTDIQFDTIFWAAIIVSALCYLIVNLVIYLSSLFLPNPNLYKSLYAMSFVLLFHGLTRAHESWFIRFFHFKTLAIRGIISGVLSGAFGIVLAMNGYGVISVVVQQITMLTISFFLMYYTCDWKPALRFCQSFARETFVFNKRLLPSAVTNTVNQNLDSMLISAVFGLTIMGYYSVAKRIRLATQMIIFTPIKGVILSSLAEIQHDEERLKRNFVKGLLILTAIMLPAFTLLAITSNALILNVFGAAWLPSAKLLSFLAIAGFFSAIIYYLENLFVIKSKPQLNSISSVGYTLSVAVLLFFLPSSLVSIGLAFSLPYIILFPMVLFLACKLLNLDVREVVKNLILLVIPTLLVGFITYCVFKYSILQNDIQRFLVLILILPPIYYLLLKKTSSVAFLAIEKIANSVFVKLFRPGKTHD